MTSLPEKHRPRNLADILGQDDVVDQLTRFVAAPYSAAFLFSGPSGTGKTSAALVLAAEMGVDVAADEFGGLWQIASGEQTSEMVRRAVSNLRVRPWRGSGWKTLIVNEADAMSPNAAYVWLDVLEAIPPQTLIVFTTNDAAKIPGRLRDRCERFGFQAGMFVWAAAQQLIDKVWLAETGRTDSPDLSALGQVADERGDISFRRVLQMLTPCEAPKAKPIVVASKPGTLRQQVYDLVAEGPKTRRQLADALKCEVGSTLTTLLRRRAIVAEGGFYRKVG